MPVKRTAHLVSDEFGGVDTLQYYCQLYQDLSREVRLVFVQDIHLLSHSFIISL